MRASHTRYAFRKVLAPTLEYVYNELLVCIFWTCIKSACMSVHYKGIAKAENRPIVTRDSLMPTCLIPIYANKAKHSRWENGGTLEERKGKGCIGDRVCRKKRD